MRETVPPFSSFIIQVFARYCNCFFFPTASAVDFWLSGLLFVLPMAACIVALIAQVSVSAVQFTMQWFENLMDMPSFSMLMPPKWLLAVTAVSAVLMLVTNPMRSLLPAIFLRGVKDEKEQEDAAA